MSICEVVKYAIGIGSRRTRKGKIAGPKPDLLHESLRPLRVRIGQQNGDKIVTKVPQNVRFPLAFVNEPKSLHDVATRAAPTVVEVKHRNG